MPSLAIEKLPTQLKKSLAPLYIIHGEELLLAIEAADLLRQHTRALGFEREVLQIEGHFNWEALWHALGALSLFADKKLLELRLPSGKPGVEGAKQLQKLAAQPPSPDVVILLILPKLDGQTLKSKWFSSLEKVGTVLAANAIEREKLGAWISQRLRAQQQTISREGEQLFVDRVEGNLLAAKQEIERLSLIAPQGELSIDLLDRTVGNVARFDPFDLASAWMQNDAARARRMVRVLQQEGESEVLILWAISEDVRALLQIHEERLHGRDLATLLRDYRIWGRKRQLIEPALQRLKPARLIEALHACAQIDRIIKGAQVGDAWNALEKLLLHLCDVQIKH